MAVEPLWIFLVTGFVALSVALSAGAINKLPDEDKPKFAQSRNGLVTVILAGNLAALTLVGAMAYGFRNLDWWIPLSCMFITFPVLHVALMQKALGDVRNLFLTMPLVVAAIGALYYYW